MTTQIKQSDKRKDTQIEHLNIPKLRFGEFSGEWEEKKLGEVCDIKTGNKDTQNKVENGKYPFFVRSNTIEKINTFSFDGEAILTSGDGVGVGKNFHYILGKFDYHQRVYSLNSFKKNYSGKFIFKVFSNSFYKRVRRLSAKNSVDSVRMDMIAGMEIYFPSLPEQQKIANFLTATDNWIENLKLQKEKLEEYKKGMMQKIFSQEIRFKSENGEDFAEWEEKMLGDVGESISSGKTKPEVNGDYPVFGSTGKIGFCDNFTHKGKTILIARVGANAGKMNLVDGNFSVTDNTLILRIGNLLNVDFIYFLLKEYNPKRLIFGSGQPLITGGQLKKIKISLPSPPEQQKIANFLTALDNQIEEQNKKIEEAEIWKKGVMQGVFV